MRANMQSAAAVLFACAVPIMASSVPPATITVPGHYANFKEAIEKGESGIVVVEPGEHRWENFLEIGQRVDVHASGGTILPGSLWLKKGSGGEFRGVEMVKESGSCMIFEGGQWNIDSCRLCCSRWAVLWCRCESEVSIKNCFLGGMEEGPGYCVNCQDHTRVTVDSSHLERSGGEYSAAIAVFHNVRVRVQSCIVIDNQFALRAVTAKDATLELLANNMQGDLWYDATRPGNLVQQGNRHNGLVIPDTGVMPSPEAGIPLA